MPRRVKVASIDALAAEIDQKLQSFKVDHVGLSLRQKVLRLVELTYKNRCLNVSVMVQAGYPATPAIGRIRLYFEQHVTVILDGAELEVVSGISEYARRIRQLRVENGLRILTGASPDKEFSDLDLKADQYVLVTAAPDTDAARRWHIANRIRRSGGSATSRLLAFLMENVERVVTTEELAYVAKNKKEFARRVRELRTEEGYAIATKVTGRPDLGIGEYVLLSKDRVAEPHDRHIPIEVQREVYQRDNNACRACGWNMSRWTVQDPRILELHHLIAHVERGENIALNLIVLCSRCHDELHAGRLDITHLTNG